MPPGLSSLGRFAEPSLLILSSLAGGPKHGYAITKDVEEWGGATLGPGTLYAALARLEKLGLIEALPAEERRRPYRLTGVGAAALRAELLRLVRLYPGAWRVRYADELLAWVAERGLGPAVALDLARGALDAHLHPDLTGTGERRTPMPDRLRGSVLGVLCGYAAFVLAGAGYQKLTEYDDFVAAAHHHTAVGAAFNTVLVASLVALGSMLAAGVAGAVAAVRRTELGTGTLRFAAGAAVVTTAAMVVMLVATVAWGLALRAADPALFHSAEGICASSTAGSWAVIVACMAAATAVAGVASARGQALREVRR